MYLFVWNVSGERKDSRKEQPSEMPAGAVLPQKTSDAAQRSAHGKPGVSDRGASRAL